MALLLSAAPALAAPAVTKSHCGLADVELTVILQDESTLGDIESVEIFAKNGKKSKRLLIEGEVGGGYENFAIACINSKLGPVLLFQLRCSGNGCPDDDGYGILRTDSLELVLSPIKNYTSNKAHAAELLGAKPPVLFGNETSLFKSW
jgi:hypothetical protein